MITLVPKEIEAIAWLAERALHGAVEIESFRDRASVGWLRAIIRVPQGRGNHSHPPERKVYAVSPLGNVYETTGDGHPVIAQPVRSMGVPA